MKFMLLCLLLMLSGSCFAQVSITSPAPPNGTEGQPYSHQFVATGGTAPYTWAVVGTLPPGLSLGATTGLLAGTPTQSSTIAYGFTIWATATAGGSVGATYSVRIDAGNGSGDKGGSGGCGTASGASSPIPFFLLGTLAVFATFRSMRRLRPERV